jgi:hypothetical protein
MPTPPIVFRWNRPANASFRWETQAPFDHPTRKSQYLVDPDDRRRIRYAPLDLNPALWRRFASMEPTPAAILGFANRYGKLGIDEALAIQGPVRWGEPLSTWRMEILRLSYAGEIWDALRNGKLKNILPYLRTGEGQTRRVIFSRKDEHGITIQFSADLRGVELAPLVRNISLQNREHVVRLVKLLLQRVINDQLEQERGASLRCVFDPEHERLALHVVPKSLLGALWVQFGRAVEMNVEYRRCQQCEGWFEVSSLGKRQSAIFCSDRCKVAELRDRQARARKLAAEGVTPEKIAPELRTTPATVEKWTRDIKQEIRKRKGRRS